MGTQVTVAPTATAVKALAALTVIVADLVKAGLGMETKKIAAADMLRDKATDAKNARQLLAASYAVAAGIPPNTTEELTEFMLKKYQADISRIVRFAFPLVGKVDGNVEYKACLAHNAKLPANAPAHARIGEVKLLLAARGKMSCADILAGKVNARKARPEGNVTGPIASENPREDLTNGFVRLLAGYVGNAGQPTLDEARKIFNEVATKRAAELKK